ncbi:hypothetical protein GCM10010515_71460 [Streptomyces fructofermentans]|uniref:Uncharacterized protein n=1 Tax=Streptomyces fructofermentans TaxID=152141 RepID=A0A918NT96_9ACTN|nr:hypothetical protein GCM10010515_71460 [Streptomyces fructofermentans]
MHVTTLNGDAASCKDPPRTRAAGTPTASTPAPAPEGAATAGPHAARRATRHVTPSMAGTRPGASRIVWE